MQVKDIMSSVVEGISQDDMLVHAAQKMRDLDVGALPVQDESQRPVGIVTDRDMVVRAIADQNNPAATPVSRIMTDKLVACRADQSVDEAIEIMEDARVKRLIVMNDEDRMVGILAMSDIAQNGPGHEVTGEAVEAILSP